MDSSTKELFVWSLNNGVRIRGLTIKDFPQSGRGVMTTRHINQNDVIIKIPRRFLITFDTVLKSMQWLIKDNSSPGLTSKDNANHGLTTKDNINHGLTAKDLFLLFILVEKWKGKESKFRIYVDSIPDAYTTPSYIPENKASLLPDFVRFERDKQRAKISGHFKRLIQFSTKHKNKTGLLFDKHEKLLYDDVMWAWNVVNTRSVYMNPRDLNCSLNVFSKLWEVDFALAPLLDMLNHESGAQVEAKFNTNSNHYEIRTFDNYQPKQQVFINYGGHGNRILFFEYGFILPNNVHVVCPIPRDLFLKHFPLSSHTQQKELLRIGISLDKMNCTSDGYFNWAFINAAHILHDRCSETSRTLPDQCSTQNGCCRIFERVLELINDLYIFYDEQMNKLQTETEGSLREVYLLLELERNILSSTKENWTSDCQVMSS